MNDLEVKVTDSETLKFAEAKSDSGKLCCLVTVLINRTLSVAVETDT